MDYILQAKTFLQRARDAVTVEERETHLAIAIDLLERAVALFEEREQ